MKTWQATHRAIQINHMVVVKGRSDEVRHGRGARSLAHAERGKAGRQRAAYGGGLPSLRARGDRHNIEIAIDYVYRTV